MSGAAPPQWELIEGFTDEPYDEARSLFDRMRDAFDREARVASEERELPAVDPALVSA